MSKIHSYPHTDWRGKYGLLSWTLSGPFHLLSTMTKLRWLILLLQEVCTKTLSGSESISLEHKRLCLMWFHTNALFTISTFHPFYMSKYFTKLKEIIWTADIKALLTLSVMSIMTKLLWLKLLLQEVYNAYILGRFSVGLRWSTLTLLSMLLSMF